jgi:hypothetical protein
MRNRRCFPQATGHRIAHAPPSSSSKTILKPQLQESLKRRPPFNPLSTEPRRVDQPLRPSLEAAFTATTSARTHAAPRPPSRSPRLLLCSTAAARFASPWNPHSGEPSPLFSQEIGLPPCRLALQPLKRRPPAANQLDFASKSPVPKGEKASLASASGRKASWAGPGRSWPNGLGPFQQYFFIYYSELIQNLIQI